ncbi:immediate early response 3-interacting protein 1-like [Paramacrobiotus metropolitanus]|uniref:immediate early response 3-interacting protein 1-like n=1 Tax=Paramacrobiotus metropolitanus TaxID=2943436 RepID=UPI0024458DCA|nr:immediate early response 3-interacting protein 1-like [Paramacrobiotus metropolitanus]
MAFTLYSLLEAGLLIVNAIAVLNEERFLRKIGWGREHLQPGAAYYQGAYAPPQSTKAQIINLINSVRTVMRFPLIFLNIGTMILLIIAG